VGPIPLVEHPVGLDRRYAKAARETVSTRIRRIHLAAGKRVIPSEKLHPLVPPDHVHLDRGAGGRANEQNRGSRLRLNRRHRRSHAGMIPLRMTNTLRSYFDGARRATRTSQRGAWGVRLAPPKSKSTRRDRALQVDEAGYTLPVVCRIAKCELTRLGALEIQVQIVLPREADAAVELNAGTGDLAVSVGHVGLGHRGGQRRLGGVLVDRPRRV